MNKSLRERLLFLPFLALMAICALPAYSQTTYTDSISGLSGNTAIKAPVRVATTANIILYGTQTIDGVAVVAGDRVLVKDQTTASENGIYNVKATAWQRAADFDGTRDAVQYTLLIVQLGTTNAGTSWRVSTADPFTIGSSNIAFAAINLVNASLDCIAGLTSAADKVPYFTGSGTCALATMTSEEVHQLLFHYFSSDLLHFQMNQFEQFHLVLPHGT